MTGRRSWLPLLLLGLGAARGPAQDVIVTPVEPKASPAGASALLQPSGDDKYSPAVDWARVPPWRQTQFFGIRAQGQVFIYVVDCSGSMADGFRLHRAKAEVRRSVIDLRWPQKFQVIFYNDRPWVMPGGIPRAAETTAKGQMINWFRSVQADGPTDPRAAMEIALGLRPDAVFLLSDGEFPRGTAEAIAAKNPHKVPVHCVDLSGGAGGNHLRQIASDSGGQYVARP